MLSRAKISVWGKTLRLNRAIHTMHKFRGKWQCVISKHLTLSFGQQRTVTLKVFWRHWTQIRPKLGLFYRWHILTHKLRKQFLITETSCLCKVDLKHVSRFSVYHKVFCLKCEAEMSEMFSYVRLKNAPCEQRFSPG